MSASAMGATHSAEKRIQKISRSQQAKPRMIDVESQVYKMHANRDSAIQTSPRLLRSHKIVTVNRGVQADRAAKEGRSFSTDLRVLDPSSSEQGTPARKRRLIRRVKPESALVKEETTQYSTIQHDKGTPSRTNRISYKNSNRDETRQSYKLSQEGQ